MTKIYESHNYILLRTDDAEPAQHRHMAAHHGNIKKLVNAIAQRFRITQMPGSLLRL